MVVVSAVPAVRLVPSLFKSALLAPLKKLFYNFLSFISLCVKFISLVFCFLTYKFDPVISYALCGLGTRWDCLTEADVALLRSLLFLFDDIGRPFTVILLLCYVFTQAGCPFDWRPIDSLWLLNSTLPSVLPLLA